MQNRLFRSKVMDRVSSPEQLHDYMRVTSPAIWMVLGAVIALLAGLLALSAVGTLETTLPVKAQVDEGDVMIPLPADKADMVKAGMTLRIGGAEIPIDAVYLNEAGETVCDAEYSEDDGLYDAVIVTDSISPIRFLLN